MVKRKGEEVHGRGTTTTVLRWRLFNLELPIDADPGKNDCGVSREVKCFFFTRAEDRVLVICYCCVREGDSRVTHPGDESYPAPRFAAHSLED